MGTKDFLRKAFPFLSTAATAFGGPIGAAGAVILGKVLGEDVRPDQLEKRLADLTTTEEGRAKAAQAEQEFSLAMSKMGFEHVEELEKIAADDRDSARQREMAVKDKMPLYLGAATVATFFVVLIALMFKAVPTDSRDVLLLMLGALTAGWKDVLGYYFGSSAGSAMKTEAINKIAEKI